MIKPTSTSTDKYTIDSSMNTAQNTLIFASLVPQEGYKSPRITFNIIHVWSNASQGRESIQQNMDTIEEKNIQYLHNLYQELSEEGKLKARNYLESLMEEESIKDIKQSIYQAGRELLEWKKGKIQLRSLDDLLTEI